MYNTFSTTLTHTSSLQPSLTQDLTLRLHLMRTSCVKPSGDPSIGPRLSAANYPSLPAITILLLQLPIFLPVDVLQKLWLLLPESKDCGFYPCTTGQWRTRCYGHPSSLDAAQLGVSTPLKTATNGRVVNTAQSMRQSPQPTDTYLYFMLPRESWRGTVAQR